AGAERALAQEQVPGGRIERVKRGVAFAEALDELPRERHVGQFARDAFPPRSPAGVDGQDIAAHGFPGPCPRKAQAIARDIAKAPNPRSGSREQDGQDRRSAMAAWLCIHAWVAERPTVIQL